MLTQPPADTQTPEPSARAWDEVAFMASMPVIAVGRSPETDASPRGASRLLVLVPDLDIDEVDLAQCVWSLAEPRGLPVLYLGTSRDPVRESPVRRRLATLAAITRDDRIRVDTRYQPAHDWPEAIRATCQPGDLIVSPPERLLSLSVNGHGSVSRALSNTLRAPVHVLPALRFDAPVDRRQRRLRLAFWPISAAILAGFFWLQVQIDQGTDGPAQMILLSLSAVVEGGLLLLWHTLTS
jgi:hypothetical protein